MTGSPSRTAVDSPRSPLRGGIWLNRNAFRMAFCILLLFAGLDCTCGGREVILDVECDTIGSQIEGRSGYVMKVRCPSGCSLSPPLYGTGLYTDDSNVCKAARHAGVIENEGGVFFLTIKPAADIYRGSEKNEIRSATWRHRWLRSFSVKPVPKLEED